MEEVIHYLDLKNQYYDKFHSVTVRFIELARQDHWEELASFVDTREKILNIIRSYDFKIAALFEDIELTDADLMRYRPRVKALFDRRSTLVHKIVDSDLDLIGIIDEKKTDALGEMRRTSASQLPDFADAVIAAPEAEPKDA